MPIQSNNKMSWTVIETQLLDEELGIWACPPPTVHTDRDQALAAYFTVCAAAAQSKLKYHAVCIIPSDPNFQRQLTEWQIFDRRGTS